MTNLEILKGMLFTGSIEFEKDWLCTYREKGVSGVRYYIIAKDVLHNKKIEKRFEVGDFMKIETFGSESTWDNEKAEIINEKGREWMIQNINLMA